jgi:hypothetical protein
MSPAATDPRQLLRRETLSFQGRALAQIAILPVGRVDPLPLIDSLDPRDQVRAASLRNPARLAEFVTARWLRLQLQLQGPTSISHCRKWLLAAGTTGTALGADVESRLPRRLPEVVERLGWQDLDPDAYLQAWTLWEAWRKLAGGSVLDEPDLVYVMALRKAATMLVEPCEVAGVIWSSVPLDGACLSLAMR